MHTKKIACSEPIPSGTELELYNADLSVRRMFLIKKTVAHNKSASVNVYVAEKDGTDGILRQVKCNNPNKFINRQRAIMERLEKEKDSERLFSIIPKRTIWEDKNGGWYLFSEREPEVMTFSSCIQMIHSRNFENADQKAVKILTCIDSLCCSISILHQHYIFHQDIKPCNFGLIPTGFYLHNIAYLFDIDSLFFSNDYTIKNCTCNTPGYTEWDIKAHDNDLNPPVNSQTDIYSIGAVLLFAFTNRRLSNCNRKTGETYTDMAVRMLQNSNMYKKMHCARAKEMLETIIRKTITNRESRYEVIQEIKNAIEETLRELNAAIAKQPVPLRQKMQQHLFRYPLYQNAGQNSPVIWVVGHGKCAEAFLDVCLPLTQCCKGTPSVHVITDPKYRTEWERYFQERPSIEEFFDCGNANLICKQPYGRIKVHIDWLEHFLIGDWINEFPNYVFLDYERDESNQDMLELIFKKIQKKERCCTIGTVLLKDGPVPDGCSVTFLEPRPEDSDFEKKLERIGRNIHWLWSSSSKSYEAVLEEYQHPKNHLNSIACALSFTYKLHMLGINETDMNRQAEKYKELYNMDADKADEMENVEHRRWCTEMCCRGFVRMDANEAAGYGKTSVDDNRIKKAACLTDRLKDSEITTKNRLDQYNKSEWINLNPATFEDPLDQLSVQYQKLLYDKGEQQIQKNGDTILIEMKKLYRHLNQNQKHTFAMPVFNILNHCIESMLSRKRQYADAYEKRMEWLCSLLKDDSDGKVILEHIQLLMQKITPMFSYKDYRHIDYTLTKQMPYMMTYSDEKALYLLLPDTAEPFTEASLKYLMPMQILDPPELHVVTYVKSKDDLNKIGPFLNYIAQIAKSGRLRCLNKQIEIIIYTSSTDMTLSIPQEELMRYCQLNDHRFHLNKHYVIDQADAISVFKKYWNSVLQESLLQYEQGAVSWLPEAKSLENAFCFNANQYRFDLKNCPSLAFLNDRLACSRCSMSVEDLRIAYDRSFKYIEQPDFFDCVQEIYNDYTTYTAQWVLFQSAVQRIFQLSPGIYNPVPVEAKISDDAVEETRLCLEALHDCNITRTISIECLPRHRSRILVETDQDNKQIIEKLLQQMKQDPQSELKVGKNGNDITVEFLSCNVELNMPVNPDEKQEIAAFLERQQQNDFIQAYDAAQSRVHFTGQQEMRMLTVPGSVDTIYRYYAALSLPECDDIALTTEGLKASMEYKLLEENDIIQLIEGRESAVHD